MRKIILFMINLVEGERLTKLQHTCTILSIVGIPSVPVLLKINGEFWL